jgi:peroxiredoxin
MAKLAVLLALLFLWVPLGFTAAIAALSVDTIALTDLAQGRWAVAFVVVPGCPACEEFIEWFLRAAQAFPEVRFLLIAPAATAELKDHVQDQIQVLIDSGGTLSGWFGVRRAPTVILSVEGLHVARLDWPFTEGFLLRHLAESLLMAVELPNPMELLGQPAPGFSARDLGGKESGISALTRPLLLTFIDANCSACWETLPVLAELAKEVAVALVVLVSEGEISTADRERLEQFLLAAEQRAVAVLVVQDLGVLRAYKVVRSPISFLIDEKEVIVGIWEGRRDGEELLEAVRAALAKKPG